MGFTAIESQLALEIDADAPASFCEDCAQTGAIESPYTTTKLTIQRQPESDFPALESVLGSREWEKFVIPPRLVAEASTPNK